MTENESTQSTSTQAWPLPSFYFIVSISNVGEVTRLPSRHWSLPTKV